MEIDSHISSAAISRCLTKWAKGLKKGKDMRRKSVWIVNRIVSNLFIIQPARYCFDR